MICLLLLYNLVIIIFNGIIFMFLYVEMKYFTVYWQLTVSQDICFYRQYLIMDRTKHACPWSGLEAGTY